MGGRGVVAQVATVSVSPSGLVTIERPPSGGADFLARVLGEEIGWAQGPTIVIENRPGAGSIIGTEAVSHAAPDGKHPAGQNAEFDHHSASAKGELRSGD
jgi:tripartite-type tricarboxylate transporter receptor subunit TctC